MIRSDHHRRALDNNKDILLVYKVIAFGIDRSTLAVLAVKNNCPSGQGETDKVYKINGSSHERSLQQTMKGCSLILGNGIILEFIVITLSRGYPPSHPAPYPCNSSVVVVFIMPFGSQEAGNRNYWILSKEVYGRFVQKLVLKQFH